MSEQTKTYKQFAESIDGTEIPTIANPNYYKNLTVLYETPTEIGFSERLSTTTKLTISKHTRKRVVCPL